MAALRASWPGLLLALSSLPAQAGDVVSPGPDHVAVTIYRDRPTSAAELAARGDDDTDGLALIVESRVVDLPAGRSRLRFQGVADGIIPQSAGVDGLPARVVERNFDFDLLSPATLIEKSVGRTARLVRTNRETGRESSRDVVLRSGPGGVVLEAGGHAEALGCGGEAERLVFDHAPPGLADRPTLSMDVEARTPGRHTVRLSYLTVRLDWSADYIARVAADGRTLALTGWITLANRTATAFVDAPTEVVAGKLARVDVDIPAADRPARAPACWPGQTTHAGWSTRRLLRMKAMLAPAPPPSPMAARRSDAAEIVVTGYRAAQSELGDYKLYTLAEPTTVAARQTKQVLFLDQPAVKFATVYAFEAGSDPTADVDEPPETHATSVVMRLDNRTADGLGLPLPAGVVQVRQARDGGAGGERLVGEPRLGRDVPMNAPFELRVGSSSDVEVRRTLAGRAALPGHGLKLAYDVVATNARAVPVTVEIRHRRDGSAGFEVAAESHRHTLKSGDPVWSLTLPAGGEADLTYTVRLDRR